MWTSPLQSTATVVSLLAPDRPHRCSTSWWWGTQRGGPTGHSGGSCCSRRFGRLSMGACASFALWPGLAAGLAATRPSWSPPALWRLPT